MTGWSIHREAEEAVYQGTLKRPLPPPLLPPSGTVPAAAGTAVVAPVEHKGLLETEAYSGTTTVPKPISATAPGAIEMPRKGGDGDNGADGDGGNGGMGDGIASPPPPSRPSRLLFGRSLDRKKWWGRRGGGSGSRSGALSSAGATTDSDFAKTIRAAEVGEAVSP